jgi:Putative transposase
MEFIRMFLQHVLPKGFQKVRYYGFLHPKNKLLFNIIRLLLRAKFRIPDKYRNYKHEMICPECGATMQFVGTLDRALRNLFFVIISADFFYPVKGKGYLWPFL